SIGLVLAVASITDVSAAGSMVPAQTPAWRAATEDLKTCAEEAGDVSIAACTRAIDSALWNEETMYSLHYLRAALYDKKGDHERAIADYDVLLRFNPNDSVVYALRGTARRELGDDFSAIADLSAAIRLDPNYAYAFNERGNARRRMGDFDKAMTDYDEAIRLD